MLGVSDGPPADPGITLWSCFEQGIQMRYMLSSHDEHCVSKWLELLIATKIEEMAGGRDCLLEYDCFAPLKTTQVPSIRALQDPDQSDCDVDAICATAVTASSSVRKDEQRKSTKSDVYHACPALRPAAARDIFSQSSSSAARSYARK